MNTPKLTIYIVDDDSATRESLGRLLFMEGYSVQAFASGQTFLAEASTEDCGVVLLDLDMDGDRAAGKDVFDKLNQRGSPLVVVFLSGTGTVSDVSQVMKTGAMDWLEKPWHPDLTLQTVAKAYEKAQDICERKGAHQLALAMWTRLTAKEKEVAQLVAKGFSSKESARLLDKDFRTVDTQRASIFSKLEVANSNELLQFMIDNDLIGKQSKD